MSQEVSTYPYQPVLKISQSRWLH